MVEVMTNSLRDFGRPRKLSIEDMILMTLMYLREYRSMAHIGATYQVHETTALRIIRRVESTLLQDKRFHLPGKKVLQASDTSFEIVLIDATECPCERPKKTESLL